MKKSFTGIVFISLVFLGVALVSCSNKTPATEQQSEEPAATSVDSSLVVAADNHLKAHRDDIQALWEISLGEDKKMAKYALAKDFVFLSIENGQEGLLLSFYKDLKDIDNFDGIPLKAGQELSFQGDAFVVKEKTNDGELTTYFERTEHEGFKELFTMKEKDGKKTYANDADEPYDEKEAQSFIDKVSKVSASPLSDNLSAWINL